MAQYLPTVTTLAQGLDGSFSIRTAYLADLLPNIISCFIAQTEGKVNGISYVEGDLVFNMTNFPTAIDVTIDPATGDLIVSGPDADKYSLVEGQLVYTY
jgi:hypothetical protein